MLIKGLDIRTSIISNLAFPSNMKQKKRMKMKQKQKWKDNQ